VEEKPRGQNKRKSHSSGINMGREHSCGSTVGMQKRSFSTTKETEHNVGAHMRKQNTGWEHSSGNMALGWEHRPENRTWSGSTQVQLREQNTCMLGAQLMEKNIRRKNSTCNRTSGITTALGTEHREGAELTNRK
jgi:hypothetical protein